MYCSKRAVSALMIAFVSVTAVSTVSAAAFYTDHSNFVSAVTGGLTTIDFSVDASAAPINHGDSLDQQFASFGVDFNGFAGGSPQVFTAPLAGNLTTEPNATGHWMHTTNPFVPGGGFELDFTSPVSAFGFWVGDLQLTPSHTTFTVYEAVTDNVLLSLDLEHFLGDGTQDWLFAGVVAGANEVIGRIEVDISDTDSVLFDSFSIQADNAVNAPHGAALLVAGLVGVFARRFRWINPGRSVLAVS